MLAQTFAFVTFNKVCTSQVRTFSSIMTLLLAYFCSVLPLVHGLPAILPSVVITLTQTLARSDCSDPVGSRPGRLAAARFPVGVPWQVNIFSRVVACKCSVLWCQLLDLGHHRKRRWEPVHVEIYSRGVPGEESFVSRSLSLSFQQLLHSPSLHQPQRRRASSSAVRFSNRPCDSSRLPELSSANRKRTMPEP